jgi:hypothetical protein
LQIGYTNNTYNPTHSCINFYYNPTINKYHIDINNPVVNQDYNNSNAVSIKGNVEIEGNLNLKGDNCFYMINGAIVGTKVVSWVGDVATLTLDTTNSAGSFANNKDETSTGFIANVLYAAKDAAGNVVTLGSQPSITGATGALVEASIGTTTNVLAAAVQTTARGYGYATMIIPSNAALFGAATYGLKVTNAAGTEIKSNVATVTVSNGSTASFTASWDKAVYAPGDIATISITAKDANGVVQGTGTALTGLTDNLITNSTGFVAVGGTCSSTSTVTNGVKTCKFSATNTEGAYSWSVDLTTSPTNQSAVVGTVNVKATSATVSNADVLKSIVALIASINKQIQALQKLILARR